MTDLRNREVLKYTHFVLHGDSMVTGAVGVVSSSVVSIQHQYSLTSQYFRQNSIYRFKQDTKVSHSKMRFADDRRHESSQPHMGSEKRTSWLDTKKCCLFFDYEVNNASRCGILGEFFNGAVNILLTETALEDSDVIVLLMESDHHRRRVVMRMSEEETVDDMAHKAMNIIDDSPCNDVELVKIMKRGEYLKNDLTLTDLLEMYPEYKTCPPGERRGNESIFALLRSIHRRYLTLCMVPQQIDRHLDFQPVKSDKGSVLMMTKVGSTMDPIKSQSNMNTSGARTAKLEGTQFRLIQELPNLQGWTLLNRIRKAIGKDAQAKVLGSGCSGSYCIGYKNNIMGIFKPCDEEPAAARHGDNVVPHQGFRPGILVGEGAIREILAYIIDQRYISGGLVGVPPTYFVESVSKVYNYRTTNGDGSSEIDAKNIRQDDSLGYESTWKSGSLQTFVHNCDIIENVGFDNISVQEVQLVAFFDLLILNKDRNAANILVLPLRTMKDSLKIAGHGFIQFSTKWRMMSRYDDLIHRADFLETQVSPTGGLGQYTLVPIDHGLALSSDPTFDEFDLCWYSAPQSRLPTSPTILRFLEKVDSGLIMEELSRVVNLRGMCQRMFQANLRALQVMLLEFNYTIADIIGFVCALDSDELQVQHMERLIRKCLVGVIWRRLVSHSKSSMPSEYLFSYLSYNWTPYWQYTDIYDLLKDGFEARRSLMSEDRMDKCDELYQERRNIDYLCDEVPVIKDWLRGVKSELGRTQVAERAEDEITDKMPLKMIELEDYMKILSTNLTYPLTELSPWLRWSLAYIYCIRVSHPNTQREENDLLPKTLKYLGNSIQDQNKEFGARIHEEEHTVSTHYYQLGISLFREALVSSQNLEILRSYLTLNDVRRIREFEELERLPADMFDLDADQYGRFYHPSSTPDVMKSDISTRVKIMGVPAMNELYNLELCTGRGLLSRMEDMARKVFLAAKGSDLIPYEEQWQEQKLDAETRAQKLINEGYLKPQLGKIGKTGLFDARKPDGTLVQYEWSEIKDEFLEKLAAEMRKTLTGFGISDIKERREKAMRICELTDVDVMGNYTWDEVVPRLIEPLVGESRDVDADDLELASVIDAMKYIKEPKITVGQMEAPILSIHMNTESREEYIYTHVLGVEEWELGSSDDVVEDISDGINRKRLAGSQDKEASQLDDPEIFLPSSDRRRRRGPWYKGARVGLGRAPIENVRAVPCTKGDCKKYLANGLQVGYRTMQNCEVSRGIHCIGWPDWQPLYQAPKEPTEPISATSDSLTMEPEISSLADDIEAGGPSPTPIPPKTFDVDREYCDLENLAYISRKIGLASSGSGLREIATKREDKRENGDCAMVRRPSVTWAVDDDTEYR